MDIQLIKKEFAQFAKFYKEKNLKLAFLCLGKILKENPNQTEAIFFSGIINVQNKNFKEAKNYFLKLIKIKPDSLEKGIEGFFNLGMTNYKLNLLDEAIGNFIAKIYKDLNNFEKSKIYYEKCLNIDPEYKNACSGYGGLLLKLNQHNKGLKYLRSGSGFVRFNEDKVEII
jgi:tetratricopeptide (TPR) repeat protein